MPSEEMKTNHGLKTCGLATISIRNYLRYTWMGRRGRRDLDDLIESGYRNVSNEL